MNNSHTIGELEAAFKAKIRAFPRKECVRVMDNFARCPGPTLTSCEGEGKREGDSKEHIPSRIRMTFLLLIRRSGNPQ